jgi:DNA replication protein DnaC
MLSEETIKKLKFMRLGGWIESWPKVIEASQHENISFEELLVDMINTEYSQKQANALSGRIKRAHIPELWEMETFPFSRQPKLSKRKTMAAFDSFDYILSQKNMVWMGPTGCGKTGLATSFLMRALERNYTGEIYSISRSCSRTLPISC